MENNVMDSVRIRLADRMERDARDRSSSRYKGDFLVLISTICWGSSYSFIKTALRELSSFNLMALRFTIAFVVTALVFNRTLRRMRLKDVGYGLALGIALFCGNALLTFGLKTTTISNAGFLMGSTVVFVALAQAVINRVRPRWSLLAGLLFSVLGVGVLTITDGIAIHTGDALCLMGALAFAIHIFIAEATARNSDSLGACIIQFGFVSLFAWLMTSLVETPVLPASGEVLAAVCVLGLFGSATGFVCQMVGQRYTTPTRTGFIYTLEPLFALFFAYILAGETLTLRTLVGGALLLLGVYISEYRSPKAGGMESA